MTRASLKIKGYIADCLKEHFPGTEELEFDIEQPEFLTQGDLASNVALALSKKLKQPPISLADKFLVYFNQHKFPEIEKVEVAHPGFVNFFLTENTKKEYLQTYVDSVKNFPKKNEKVMTEYTDPNCFKVFHAGHLMSNTIGEALSRLYEAIGYEVTRVCYPSDVGRNVAIGVWGVMQNKENLPGEQASLQEKAAFLGDCYTFGNEKFETDEKVKEEVTRVNQAIYEKSDKEVMKYYEIGRRWSLDYFEMMYALLGTNFDNFIYESEVSEPGLKIVRDNISNGIFKESQGAIVYEGEKDGLHTRVFINKIGLPTYEAKDLGNYEKKLQILPDASFYIAVTANEQNDYFRVVNTVASKINPKLNDRLIHIGHGVLRLPEGKMSSRKGNVISAEDLIEVVAQKVRARMEAFEGDEEEKAELANDIAIGAIKFSILKQAPGKDIIFDMENSISFEGDSGPYIQYTHARICALLRKAQGLGIAPDINTRPKETAAFNLENILLSHGDAIQKAYDDLGPHFIVNYLLSLCREFNSVYGETVFVDKNKKESAYYVAITQATRNVISCFLEMLGMTAPEKM